MPVLRVAKPLAFQLPMCCLLLQQPESEIQCATIKAERFRQQCLIYCLLLVSCFKILKSSADKIFFHIRFLICKKDFHESITNAMQIRLADSGNGIQRDSQE